MSWSLGEIQTLAVKATRGAGHPWGVAEEAGWAVRWLSVCGLPGAEALAAWIDGAGGACPLTLGMAIADTGDTARAAAAGAVSVPLLLVPFAARAAGAGALEMTVGAQTFRVWGDGTDLLDDLPMGIPVSLSRAGAAKDRVQAIAPAALQALQDSAARTYAPATESSRLKGAGAGLTDND